MINSGTIKIGLFGINKYYYIDPYTRLKYKLNVFNFMFAQRYVLQRKGKWFWKSVASINNYPNTLGCAKYYNLDKLINYLLWKEEDNKSGWGLF